jgi:hypothetical protein
LDFDEFIPNQLRATVFTPRIQHFQVARVAGELLHLLPRFSGDPTILPIPADAPDEIPRVVLGDPVGETQFQVAPSRSDLTWTRKTGAYSDIESFFTQAVDTLEVLLRALNARPGRLAAGGVFSHKSSDPVRVLADHFCKPEWVVQGGPLADLRAFELHATRRFQLFEGLVVNSLTRCRSGSVSEAGVSSPAIVLDRDVNTLAEESHGRQFDPDTLRNFMLQAGSKLEEEIPEFFRRSS